MKSANSPFGDFEGLLAKLDIKEGLEKAVNLIQTQTAKGKKIMLIGNGGSAAIASHQSTDFFRTAGIKALAFNDLAMLTCMSNDFGYPEVFAKPIATYGDEGDILIAISSSGQSVNILNGVSAAKKRNCEVITLSGFKGNNPLRKTGKINFYVPSTNYGHVETLHLLICHEIVDELKKLKRG